jgi:hypothetical protein
MMMMMINVRIFSCKIDGDDDDKGTSHFSFNG